MEALFEKARESCDFLKSRFKGKIPYIAIILGSGLGDVVEELKPLGFIFYKDIPNFPLPTVTGHEGKLWWGERKGRPFIVFQGRVHFYEGYELDEVTLPIRAVALWGVKVLIVTASVGGITESLIPGEVVLLRDHINLVGLNPLRGINDYRFGDRFVNMFDAYDSNIREVLKSKFNLREVVYAWLPGPSYETPAEIRALRVLGADVVGMSVVPEVVVARQMGLKVLGLAGVANMAAGVQGTTHIAHEGVLKAMEVCKVRLKDILVFCLEEL